MHFQHLGAKHGQHKFASYESSPGVWVYESSQDHAPSTSGELASRKANVPKGKSALSKKLAETAKKAAGFGTSDRPSEYVTKSQIKKAIHDYNKVNGTNYKVKNFNTIKIGKYKYDMKGNRINEKIGADVDLQNLNKKKSGSVNTQTNEKVRQDLADAQHTVNSQRMKPISEMTTEELKKATDRMDAEKAYLARLNSRVVNTPKTKKELVADFFKENGAFAVKTLTKSAIEGAGAGVKDYIKFSTMKALMNQNQQNQNQPNQNQNRNQNQQNQQNQNQPNQNQNRNQNQQNQQNQNQPNQNQNQDQNQNTSQNIAPINGRPLFTSASNQANNISSVGNSISRTDNSSQSNQRPLFSTPGQNVNTSSISNPVSRTNDTFQRSLFSTPGQNGDFSSISNPVRNTSLRSLLGSGSNQDNNISSIGNPVSRTDNSSQSNQRPLFRTPGATEKEKESQRISPVNKLLRKQLNIKMAELERSASEVDAYSSAASESIRRQLNANYYESVRSSSSLRSLLGSGSTQANNIPSAANPVSRTNDTSQRSLFSTPGQNGNASGISNPVRSSSLRSLSPSNQANNISSIGNPVSRTDNSSQRSLFSTSGQNGNASGISNPVRSSSLRSLFETGSNQANNISSVGNTVSRIGNSSQSNMRPLFRTSGTAEKEKERQRILADNERLREQFNRRMAELERSTSEIDAYNEAALASIRRKLNTNYNDLYGRNR